MATIMPARPVDKVVHFQVRDVREISSRYKYGFIVTNPPYGQRIGEKKENNRLYQDMAKPSET